MKKLALILPFLIVLAACGGSTSSTSGNGTPPTPPAGTPNPAMGQWVIVTQSNVMPGQQTVANFDMASVQATVNGYQFGIDGAPGTQIPAAISPTGSFGWTYPQCLPYGTVNSAQNCPTVNISGFVGVGTPTGVSITIVGLSSNVTLESAFFSGTMSADGTTITGTYTAAAYTPGGQVTQTDSGSFYAAVLTSSAANGNYVGTVAIESCGPGGINCSAPEDVALSLTYSGSFSAPGGSLQFIFQGNAYAATLGAPSTKTVIGGLFTVGLTDPSGAGAGTFNYVPGVNFSVPPVAQPSLNTLLVNFSIPNGNATYAIRGFLAPGNVLPAASSSIGAAASFTYNAGVIAQTPLITFSPVTPVASTSFCAGGCSQTGFVALPASLSITISQPVTQGYLRVFVLDTSAPATAACPPSGQITACSFMNYPGNGIYVGDFTPGGGFTLQGVIPGGNTVEPTDNLEVVIVNSAGAWTGTVTWQLNY